MVMYDNVKDIYYRKIKLRDIIEPQKYDSGVKPYLLLHYCSSVEVLLHSSFGGEPLPRSMVVLDVVG